MDLSALPTAGALARGPHVSRWRPGLGGVRYAEVFASGREASGPAAALALLRDGLRISPLPGGEGSGVGGSAASAEHPHPDPPPQGGGGFDGKALLWVQDAASLRLTGRPYRPGLPPALRGRVIHVVARSPEDALFALEEGVRCRELAGVIGEIAGNPKALDFTASRRLTLAAERHGVPLMLVRLDAARDLSSARMRWQVTAAPSPTPRWNAAAPGMPSWHVELFRARAHAPGEWILTDDGHDLVAAPQKTRSPDHGDLAAAAGDRSLAAG